MEKDKGTPCSEPIVLEFNTQLLFIAEPAPGKISISFDELVKNLKHELKEFTLAKVNFKTVVAALKGSHPQILSATLEKNVDEVFEMQIKVAYEFLPEIVEKLVFEKREISEDESQQVAVRNMRNYLHNIKEQIALLTNVQTISGTLQSVQTGEGFQICARLNHKNTIFTLSLSLISPNGTNIKLQMFYFNTLTKQRKSAKVIPDEGIFLHHGGDVANLEVRFHAEMQDWDSVLFVGEGKWTGNYLLAMEKVEIIK